jgi:hypothetical protein
MRRRTASLGGLDSLGQSGYLTAFPDERLTMASNTMATWNKRDRAHGNAGRKRKNKESKKSTQSYVELFAGFGEPGKPAPKK